VSTPAKSGSRKKERIDRLLAELAQNRTLHIAEASRRLGVSEMTIRRDIQENQDKFGYLGGYVVPADVIVSDGAYDLTKAADAHLGAKRKACEFASKYLRADETIFIDCGTTLVHIIDLIPDDLRLTVVCYALNVTERLTRKPNVTTILLGGVYHPASATFSGPSGIETLSFLGINTALLSAAGFSPAQGATCAHFHEAEIKRKVMSISSINVLVMDTSKFGRIKPARFAAAMDFDAIITELGEAPPQSQMD
jgi:DeoR family deoxyribose operon repressor